MASLGTLVPASPLDANDATRHAFTNDTDLETSAHALGNTPADFNTMDANPSWQVDYSVVGYADDTYGLQIRIVNGATILAAADSGGTFSDVDLAITSATDVLSAVTAFAYTNTTANKATWDGASVEIRQLYSKSKGNDGGHVEVDYVAITGTYTAAAAAFTLTADQQSYALTGNALTSLLADRQLPAVQQDYTLTGYAAGLNVGVILTADQQSYTLTGNALTSLLADRQLTADQQSYAMTGFDAAFTRSLILPADQQSYALTGFDAALPTGVSLTADQQSYAMTGFDATFKRGVKLPADQQSYALTGFDVAFGTDVTMLADQQSYAMTGFDAAFKRGLKLPADQQSYTLTGFAAGLKVGEVLPANMQSYSLTGFDAAFTRSIILTADQQSYGLTGNNAGFIYSGGGAVLTAVQQSYAMTGNDAALRLGKVMAADSSSFALTGNDVAFANGEKTISCTLVTRTGVAIPSLSNLSWAWFDETDPINFVAPSEQGEIETTDIDGIISIPVLGSTLLPGQSGTLVLRSNDGVLLGAYGLAVTT
tara:strand:- start:25313 stop:26932 length:1620 start_codon:yes stop_codon:yes gene_type:complete